MTAWAIVTGAGTGIGRALAIRLAKQNLKVLCAGRRRHPLEETCAHDPTRLFWVEADVSSSSGREAITANLPEGDRLSYLIHNAAVLGPVKPLAAMEPHEWREHMAINLEGPLFLTNILLHRMEKGTRILHISSGAAHGPHHGWGAYCTSKAALYQVYRCMDLELRENGIRVGSVRPGVVDTPMQGEVRAVPESVFPNKGRFVAMKENGELTSPQKVARFLHWLLASVNADRFAAEEWDIRDQAHQNEWNAGNQED